MKARDYFVKGMVIFYKDIPCQIHEFFSVHPENTKGFFMAHVRNLHDGEIYYYRFNAIDYLEHVPVEYKKLSYVRTENGHAVVTDQDAEVQIPLSILYYGADFLTKGIQINTGFYNNKVLLAEMPEFVIGKIAETAPSLQNAPASNDLKPATFENGTEVRVPMFINTGDSVRIETRTGKYIARISS